MPKKIVVVEDDSAIQEVIEIVLKDEGYDITSFNDATQLQEQVKKLRPSLILLDLTLPHINGQEAATKLKQDKILSSIPIILLSGMQNIKEVTEECGADAYLEKPFNVEALVEIVKKFAK